VCGDLPRFVCLVGLYAAVSLLLEVTPSRVRAAKPPFASQVQRVCRWTAHRGAVHPGPGLADRGCAEAGPGRRAIVPAAPVNYGLLPNLGLHLRWMHVCVKG